MRGFRNIFKLSAASITVMYLSLALLWILLSDALVAFLIKDPDFLSSVQSLKGILFVLFTGLLLYFLVNKSNENARKENELFEQVFNTIPVLITIFDPQVDNIRVNKEVEKTLGWQNREIQDIDLLKAVYPNDEYRSKVQKFMAEDNTGWREFELRTKSGETRTQEWTNIRLSDETVIGIGIDITEAKNSRLDLYRSRELLKKTFEALKESVILVDPETRTITDCNHSTEELFGYSKEEMIGQSTEMLHADSSKFAEFNERGISDLEQEGVFHTEFTMKKKDGTLFESGHTVSLVYDEKGKVENVVSVIRDITAKKKYERELKSSNQLFESTIQNLPIGVAVNEIGSGKATLMNDKFAQVYGWPKRQLRDIDTFFEKVYPDPEQREKLKNRIMSDLRSGEADRMSWEKIRITREDGTTRIVNAKNIPVYDHDLMISTVVDVTNRVEAERQLAESEQKYRNLFEQNPRPMWIYNPLNLKFVEVNEAAIEHYGYTKDEFENMTLLDIRPEEEKEELLKNVSDSSGYSPPQEWKHKKKNGEIMTVEVSASPIKYFNKTYRLVLANDITEQKEMEAVLRESEEKFSKAFHYNPNIMVLIDIHDKSIIDVNKAYVDKLGYSKEEVTGKSGKLGFTLDQSYKEAGISALEKAGRLENFEVKTKTKKGEELICSVYAEPIELNDQPIFVLTLIDITEQKRAEEKIISSLIEGENRERRRIAQELHDGLGQYLAAANMNLDAIKDTLSDLERRQKQKFNNALDFLQRALSETRSISHNLMPRVVEDYGLVLAVETLVDQLWESNDITFNFYQNIDDENLGDDIKINVYRIIQEALANAIKYAEASKINIQIVKDDLDLILTIEDNGIGFDFSSPENQKGLGLRTIYTRAEVLGGTCEIDTKPDKGTLISITIPIGGASKRVQHG